MRRPGMGTIGRGAALALGITCASCAAPLAHVGGKAEAQPHGTGAAAAPAPTSGRDAASRTSGEPTPTGDAARPDPRAPEDTPDSTTEAIERTAAPAQPARPRSSRLPSGFHNPMPGGVMAGYRADTGLDIAGSPRPVYAIAAGTLDYSEPGHTLWVGPRDTANTVRMQLAESIPWKGRKITHVWYAHLSALETHQPEGWLPRRRIQAGEQLGISGTANHSPHLHIGMLLDNEVSQSWGTFLLEDEVRVVLGGYKRGAKLPEEAALAGGPAAALLGGPSAPTAAETVTALLPR